jgi:hypothetical protein
MDTQIGNLEISGIDHDGEFGFTLEIEHEYINIKQAEDLILFLQKEIANHELKKLTEKFTEGL